MIKHGISAFENKLDTRFIRVHTYIVNKDKVTAFTKQDIEIDSVEMCKYNEVTAEFAHAEGEGDRSLKWWREAHWRFFGLECDELDINPSEDMLLVLERFKVVYK